MNGLRLAFLSVYQYLRLVASGSLYLSSERLWTKYSAGDGKTYAVFRETRSNKDFRQREVTLVVAFRIRIVGSNRLFHSLFQRLCILNTPIWVGFRGFRAKRWMVEPRTRDYLGLYRYQGMENAEKYAKYMTGILRPLSTKKSVWYEILDEKLQD